MGRAFIMACETPWLIVQDQLQMILEIAARESEGPEAVAARLGKELDYSRSMTYRDDGGRRVAVIPIEGPIFRRADWFTEISAAATTQQVATDLAAARDDPSVGGIVLEIDSPGGEATGIAELAAMVRAATEAKPVVAYADGQAASALYWVASAASELVVSPLSLVGSIGTVMAVPDPSRTSARHVKFISSQSPLKQANPNTESGQAALQAIVDSMTDVFVDHVAKYRNVSRKKVLSDFGRGSMLVGAEAVRAGMADSVGDFESIIARLTASKPALRNRSVNMNWQLNALRSMFSGGDPVPDPEPPPHPEPTPAPTPPPPPGQSATQDDEVTRLRAEVEQLRGQQESDRLGRLRSIGADAEAFAARLVKDDRILPARRATVAEAVAQAALDDAGIGSHIAVAQEGKVIFFKQEGPFGGRSKMIRDLFASAEKHPYRSEGIPSTTLSNDPPTAEQKAEDDRKAALRERVKARAQANGSH